MKNIIIILSLIAYLSGCKASVVNWQVSCDSGFKTPLSTYTFIEEGIVQWRKKKGEGMNHRKMLRGEICTDTRIVTKK